ncbi:hypothetical protein D9613_012371 [Agrocybe pediades]|uniref:Oxidase ustYa n=1 Tax=Agrocybe pediades TaxID=84607 RepID=A0A8H4QS27_9AGAR|nr:hypothetical protein D9613_012371 [Agrocybe pediades]
MAYKLLSRRLLRYFMGSLALSVILNIARLAVLVFSDDYVASNHPSSLPIKLKSVALDSRSLLAKPERYGLNKPEDWTSLIPHHGFVSLSDGSSDLYELSMYHQIHCLMGYRQYVNAMLEGRELKGSSIRHVDHCSSYLTQLMMCAADTTLEPTTTRINNSTGRRVHLVNSDGVVHRCRDWSQVGTWAEDHFYRWEKDQKHYKGEDLN